MSMTEETIVTCPSTGGKKGVKPERWSLVPWVQFREVARVYNFGSGKYDEYNWARGYDWSKSHDSLIRHIDEFWTGKAVDDESGLHPLAHAIFHCLTLMYFDEHHPGLDDRHIP